MLVIAGALTAYPITGADSLVPAVALLGAAGMLFTLLALFWRTVFVGPALFGLTAEYVMVEATGRTGALSIAAYAAGLVVLAEILLWLGQVPSSSLVAGRVLAVWLRNLGLTAVAGATLGLISLGAASFEVPGVLAGTLVGCAAALVLLTLPWLLARGRHAPERREP